VITYTSQLREQRLNVCFRLKTVIIIILLEKMTSTIL